jgi:hypothetical protein
MEAGPSFLVRPPGAPEALGWDPVTGSCRARRAPNRLSRFGGHAGGMGDAVAEGWNRWLGLFSLGAPAAVLGALSKGWVRLEGPCPVWGSRRVRDRQPLVHASARR